MARKKPNQDTLKFGHERLDEVACVLMNNADATDSEICDAVNGWWKELGHNDPPLRPSDVTEIRSELGIAQTARKPFQKRLFET